MVVSLQRNKLSARNQTDIEHHEPKLMSDIVPEMHQWLGRFEEPEEVSSSGVMTYPRIRFEQASYLSTHDGTIANYIEQVVSPTHLKSISLETNAGVPVKKKKKRLQQSTQGLSPSRTGSSCPRS
jgi:hypothetical protein